MRQQDTHSPDQFHYTPAHTEQNYSASYSQITTLDTTANPASSGQGIQVFGTTAGVGAHYLIKSYFNGYSGCNEIITDINDIKQGPDSVLTRNIAVTNFGTCPNSVVLSLSAISTGSSLCSATSLASGDNSRISTNVNEPSFRIHSVFPNPTSHFLHLPPGSRKIKIHDNLGKLLYEEDVINSANVRLDLRKAGIHNGIYLLKYELDGQWFTAKFVISE